MSKYERYITLVSERQCALIIKKNTFANSNCFLPHNDYQLVREDAIEYIIRHIDPCDIIVSTTGKISREVYEVSERILGKYSQSFLTVGSMGHASMIALGIALEKPDRKVYCLDGDGAAFMHMGALPFIARQMPANFIHILINNNAHESVGGMPTGISGMNYCDIAKVCGYSFTYLIINLVQLQQVLKTLPETNGPVFIEIKVSIDSRKNLGRPKEHPSVNKKNFMEHLSRQCKGEN